MIEVTARFDELNNLDWAKQLEEVGVHVVYGLTQLDVKTHAKLGQVVRKENGELRTIAISEPAIITPRRQRFTPTFRFSRPIPPPGATCRKSSIT